MLNSHSKAVNATLAKQLGVSAQMFSWLAALDRLASVRMDWDKPEHHERTSTRDEGLRALRELDGLADRIVELNGVSPEMTVEIAEWVNFDTGSGPDHHEEYVRDEAIKVLDKIAVDSESRFRIGLIGLESTLRDGVIKMWAANKLADSHRREAVPPLRAELARWEKGEVHSALSAALEKLESIKR